MLLVSNPRHLPCVEKVDPGLALLDLEQRAVVGEQPRLELLNHLDLQEKQTGQTFTDWLVGILGGMDGSLSLRPRRARLLRLRNSSTVQMTQ